ncbi:uncharacterized protein [Dermacentor albipictus]|uniref:uncharacterized protein n=1 Tax=Dermacentor albipictus TaxID=60249 RepID=UPI0038FCBF85
METERWEYAPSISQYKCQAWIGRLLIRCSSSRKACLEAMRVLLLTLPWTQRAILHTHQGCVKSGTFQLLPVLKRMVHRNTILIPAGQRTSEAQGCARNASVSSSETVVDDKGGHRSDGQDEGLSLRCSTFMFGAVSRNPSARNMISYSTQIGSIFKEHVGKTNPATPTPFELIQDNASEASIDSIRARWQAALLSSNLEDQLWAIKRAKEAAERQD